MEYYSVVKKKQIMNFEVKWMELKKTVLSEVTQTILSQWRSLDPNLQM